MKHIDLLAEASINIEHVVAIKDNIYIGHPYEYNSTKLLAESDINNAIISVRLSDKKAGFTDYQEYQDWVLTQQRYIDTYNMLKDKKTINFIDEYCPILKTLEAHFVKTNDTGFAVKGYNFVNEFCLFKNGVFSKHIFGDTYFSYFRNENIVLYITKCTKGTSHAFYHSMQNIEVANTIHKELREQNITQVNVIVHNNNNNSDDVFCKQCIDNELFVNEDIFSDIKKFSAWYSTILEKTTSIRLKLERHDIMKETKIEKKICKSFKKHIITYEALEKNVLPSFSNDPEDQMEELKKLIVLSPNQFKALHSNHKHILLRGSYGSGKSLILFKKFEQVIDKMSNSDILYFICNDQQSEFIHYMKDLVSKYSTKNVIVCKSKEITPPKNTVPKLSYILNHIKHMWKDRTVHVLIDEFNGSYFNEKEIKQLKSILPKFQKSYIFIALQSMEQITDDKDDESDKDVGYRFNLLTKATSFTCFNLDYSLRSSREINEFVKATAEVIESSQITFDEVHTFAEMYTIVDSEQGMEYLYKFSSLKAGSVVARYKYNQNEEIGHTVSAGMVNIYNSNSKNGIKDSYIVYLSTLVYILKDQSELKKYVICTYDENVYAVIYFYLKNKSSYGTGKKQKWTDKIKEFVNSKSTFTVLLTDYAAVRGYEFKNFIFLLPIGKKFLMYRMLECFARSTTELHIISDDMSVRNESIDGEIIEIWKNLKCVNFTYCSYEKSTDKVYLSNVDDIIYCKANASEVYGGISKHKYPWNYIPYKVDERVGEQLHDHIWIGLRYVLYVDNVRLFNDFINLHKVDLYMCHENDYCYLLHIASKYDAVCISQMLINDYKIDVNLTEKCQSTPLIFAAYYGSSNMVNILIKNGANVNVNDENAETALHISSDRGHVNIVEILLNNGADVHVKDQYGETPLHKSSHEGHEGIVQLLLNNGADVHEKDNVGETPLHKSSHEGHINVVRLLLDKGADINVKNAKHDYTPIHMSSYEGYKDIVRLLLDKNADANAKDEKGQTAIDSATLSQHDDIVELLLNY